MALNTDPNHLAREIHASAQALEKHYKPLEPMLQMYHGSYWDDSPPVTGTGKNDAPKYSSHIYEYVSLMLPRMVHQAPQFTLETTRGARQQEVVEALQRGMNHWAQASRLHEPLEEIAQDALFGWGGAFIEEVPHDRLKLTDDQRAKLKGSTRRPQSVALLNPEDAERPHWPRVRRLEPGRWGWDTAATSESGIRFWWHKVTVDLEELKEKAKEGGLWIPEAVQDLVETTDKEELGYSKQSSGGTPERKQVTYFVVWVPDARLGEEPGEDEHGVIFTLTANQTGDNKGGRYLREPYYFYGPVEGPYLKVGFYRVPGSTVPLSPLVATQEQANIVGRINQAMVKRAEAYKKGAAYDLKDKKAATSIADSDDNDLTGIPGITRDALVPYELGGITPQDLTHHAFLLDRLQSASGMDDVQRGNVSGSGTATEVAIASESSQVRVGYMIQKWRQFVADCAMRVCWYAAHDDRIIFSYRVEEGAREQMAQQLLEAGADRAAVEVFMRYGSMTFEGGDFRAEDYGDELEFGDLDVRVEPFSMQRRDQRTVKMDTLEAVNVLSNYLGLAVQGAPLHIGKLAEMLAEVYALPELTEVVDADRAAELGVLAMEERVAAMQSDTPAAGEEKSSPGQASSSRSRGPADGAAVGQTQSGVN